MDLEDNERLIYEQLGIAARWYTGVEIGLRKILARLLGDSHTAHAFADAVAPYEIIQLIKKTKKEAALSPAVDACLSVAFRAALRAGAERNSMLHSAWSATITDEGEVAGSAFSSQIYSRKLTAPVSLDSLKKTNDAILAAATVVGLIPQMLPSPEDSIPFWAKFPDEEAFRADVRANPEKYMPPRPDTSPNSIWGLAAKTLHEVWGLKVN